MDCSALWANPASERKCGADRRFYSSWSHITYHFEAVEATEAVLALDFFGTFFPLCFDFFVLNRMSKICTDLKKDVLVNNKKCKGHQIWSVIISPLNPIQPMLSVSAAHSWSVDKQSKRNCNFFPSHFSDLKIWQDSFIWQVHKITQVIFYLVLISVRLQVEPQFGKEFHCSGFKVPL